jgi:predicted DNA-binding mobile mystery protein A
MRTELNDLRLRQVDESTRPFAALADLHPPAGGWVKSIRQALGMSVSQLGRRMGLTRQGVADLEKREAQRGVTLAALQKAADAMNAELVYAIVPRKSLTQTLRDQARTTADRQLRRVAHSMRLEAQNVSPEEYASQLSENQEKLLQTWSRQIWDEEDPSAEFGNGHDVLD